MMTRPVTFLLEDSYFKDSAVLSWYRGWIIGRKLKPVRDKDVAAEVKKNQRKKK